VGETLKGFGGIGQPVKLGDLYGRVAQILNKAEWQSQLTFVESACCIDEAAVTIVAGNIRAQRRHAPVSPRRMAPPLAQGKTSGSKDAEGNWSIDPDRGTRCGLANHTRVSQQPPLQKSGCSERWSKQSSRAAKARSQFRP